MARVPFIDVKRPPTPFDSAIEGLMSKAGKWSTFDADRALTILELYRNTNCPEPEETPAEVSIREVGLWWEHFTEFQDAVFAAPLTGTADAAARLRYLRDKIDQDCEDELAYFDTIVGHLAADANALAVPACPYQEAAEAVLFRFSEWNDQDVAEAVRVVIAYRAWHWRTVDALSNEDGTQDEIGDQLYLRLGCLEEAIRIARVTGPVGAAAKIRLLLDQDADDLKRYDTAEVLTSVLAGLDRATAEISEADLKEAA